MKEFPIRPITKLRIGHLWKLPRRRCLTHLYHDCLGLRHQEGIISINFSGFNIFDGAACITSNSDTIEIIFDDIFDYYLRWIHGYKNRFNTEL